MIKTLHLLILLVVSVFSFSQQQDNLDFQKVEFANYKDTVLENLLLIKINERREQLNVQSLVNHKFLKTAAFDQASFVSGYGDLKTSQSGKKKTTGMRIEFYGGAQFGEELLLKYSIKKGDKAQNYDELANAIAFKWLKSKKSSILLEDPKFILAGVSAYFKGNKIYISFVLGNYRSLKSGSDRISELKFPFSEKGYGLKDFDYRICKKVSPYKHLSNLQKGLYVENGIIYFETNKYKSFKKMMRNPTDGIAVDIVQKDQYSCQGSNIVDHNTAWKGILIKPLWAPKMHIKNTVTDLKAKKNNLKVELGNLPKGLTGDFEFNLIIIQDKHICANVSPNYIEDAAQQNSSKPNFLADTVSFGETIQYKPISEQTELLFKVPFKRNKSNYLEADIQPIIKSLNEPVFIIDEIEIFAFSSIEGDYKSNKKLQFKRAKNIEKVLKSFISSHKNIQNAKVSTNNNWEMFKSDVMGTEYEFLSKKTLLEVQNYILENKLDAELEPILMKHRYAEIKLKVTYDLDGEKEQAYVLNRFNKAVVASDRIKALTIQKHIFKKVVSGDYDRSVVDGQNIPENTEFAGLLMNKYWLENFVNEHGFEDDLCDKVHSLYLMDASNPYLFFNDVFCEVKHADLADEVVVNNLRKKMDQLYQTNLPEQTIDNLNLEYLFGIIDAVDTLPITPEMAVISMKKIKELVDVEEMNKNNALKLSYLFIEHNDYNYSAQLLEPFLDEENVDENLLFIYISLATHSNIRIGSKKFEIAISKALAVNKERLLTLFNSQRISMQVFDNPKVKEKLCKALGI